MRQHDEAVLHRVEALVDVLLAQRRADRALLDDLHRRRQRAGAHQQRDVVGLARRHAAADLHAAAADFLADHRRGDDFRLALLDQHDGHPLADVVARDLLEDARAAAVQVDVHGGLVAALVEAGLRVVDPVAGQHHLPLDQYLLAVALGEEIAAERHVAGAGRLQRAGLLVDHPDLERRRAAEDVLGARGVLHARQLDDHALGALLLDDRLRHAQFVHAVAQDLDVLLDRAFLDALLRFGLQPGDEPQFVGAVAVAQREIGIVLVDGDAGLDALGRVLEPQHDVAAVARDAAVLDLLAAHERADVGRVAVAGLVDGGLHVDLQQEVHAAAQVQTQVHRQRADGRQPLRRRGQRIQRDDVVFAELGLQHVLGLQLRVRIGEAHLDAGRVERGAAIVDAGGLQRVLDRAQERRVDLELRRADLDGRHFRKEVRQRVQEANAECDGDHDVLPEGIAVHGVDRNG